MTRNFYIFVVLSMLFPAISNADLVVKKDQAAQLICSFWLPKTELEVKKIKNQKVEEERLGFKMHEGLYDQTLVGHPALPYYFYRVVLPYAMTIDRFEIQHQFPQRKVLDHEINFIPAPISPDDIAQEQKRAAWEDSLAEDENIYKKNKVYQGNVFDYEIKNYRGYQVLEMKIRPFGYQPITRELYYDQNVQIKLTLKEDDETKKQSNQFFRDKEADKLFVKNLVVNDDELDSYKEIANKKELLSLRQE